MSSPDPRVRTRADLALLAMTAAWGSTFTIVQASLADAPPQTFVAARFWIATAAVLVAALVTGTLVRPTALRRGALLGLPTYAGFVLQTHGLAHTTPSRSAFVTGLAVLFVPILGVTLFKRRSPASSTWAGIALALGGLTLLTRPWESAASATYFGDALTLGGALAFALQILGTESLAPGQPLPPLVLGQVGVTAVLATLGAFIEGGAATWTPRLMAALVGTALVTTALAFAVQAWAQQRTTAARVALIFALEPVFAAGFSAVFVGERLDPPSLAGGAMIIAGVLVAELWPLLMRRRAAV